MMIYVHHIVMNATLINKIWQKMVFGEKGYFHFIALDVFSSLKENSQIGDLTLQAYIRPR